MQVKDKINKIYQRILKPGDRLRALEIGFLEIMSLRPIILHKKDFPITWITRFSFIFCFDQFRVYFLKSNVNGIPAQNQYLR